MTLHDGSRKGRVMTRKAYTVFTSAEQYVLRTEYCIASTWYACNLN